MNTETKSNWKHKPLVALAVLGLATLSSPASATTILLGTDYLTTGYAWAPGIGELIGVPIPGFEPADTIVQRKANCDLGSGSCTIPIEMTALSLQALGNSNVLIRESPTLASLGQMTISGDANGGTFTSFFDIFWDLSIDGGSTWASQAMLTLSSSGSTWEPVGYIPPDALDPYVPGLVGDQAANYHTNKVVPDQYDFKVLHADEQHPSGFKHVIPEPASLALLGLGLGALGFARRRRAA